MLDFFALEMLHIYHRLAATINNDIYEVYFDEWLEALPHNIRVDMSKLGFLN